MKKFPAAVFLFTLCVTASSCALSPGADTVRKGVVRPSVQFCLPVGLTSPGITLNYLPFPVLSLQYGVTDELNAVYRLYPFFLAFAVWSQEALVVWKFCEGSGVVPRMALYGGAMLFIRLDEWRDFPLFPSLGLNFSWGDTNARIYFAPEATADFHLWTGFTMKFNARLGWRFRAWDRLFVTLELSQNSIGHVNQQMGSYFNTYYDNIGFPSLNAGVDYDF